MSNKQNVTDALKTYLYKVDEVANMEVVGLYIEMETDNSGKPTKTPVKLHVFSRTRNAPYFFYYRYLDILEMNWYPWEKMQVDIPSYDVEDNLTHKISGNGCYLTPVAWNGRLLIFFPQFMKKTKPNDKASGKIKNLAEQDQNELKPIEYWEIKMAWSEYRNGKWTQKQLSKEGFYDDGVYTTTSVSNAEMLRTAGVAEMAREAVGEALEIMNQAQKDYFDSLYIAYYYPTYIRDLSVKLFYSPTLTEREVISNEIFYAPPGLPQPPWGGHGRYIEAAEKKTVEALAHWHTSITELDTANNTLKSANQAAEAAAKAYNEALKDSYTKNTIADISKFRFVPVFSNDNLADQLPGIKVFNGSIEKGVFEFNGSQITPKTKSYLWNGDNYLTIFHHLDGLPYISTFQKRDENSTLFFNDKPLTTFSYGGASGINFHHPYTHQMLGHINAGNLGSFFTFYNKRIGNIDKADAFGTYDNDKNPNTPAIYHELKHPYSLYNWELFFHTPIMLADALSKAQQFEEAMKWFHYVFNPIAEGEDDQRFWQFAPFKEINSKNILEQIFNSLKGNTPNDAISEWRNNPFKPHLVARRRPVAYMKWVVMKYIDNILDWGDYLFRQDTIESINQSTQLYILSGHILGARPMMIPKPNGSKPQTYLSLLDKWDAFGNAMNELEVVTVYNMRPPKNTMKKRKATPTPDVFGAASALYFCIPKNPKLQGYWDTLADRLFKIRHCQNIEGIFRKLPLFEPPIDPALLVKAAAQGLSISSVVNDLNSATPNYRFYYLLQKALELCNELKSLGGAMLSAIEKKDNEAMSLIRARHEGTMNNLMMEIKKLQLEESQKSLESLYQNRKAPEAKMKYYLQLIGEDPDKVPGLDSDFAELANSIEKPVDESGLRLSKYEKEEMDNAAEAHDMQKDIGQKELLASILHLLPTASVDGKPMGIGLGVQFGGPFLGGAMQAVAKSIQNKANEKTFSSTNAAKKGGFQRALQERIMQANAAGYELKQIDKQITAQQIRIHITNQEILNQQKQIDNAHEVEEFLKNKYTNEELYTWMRGSLKTLYHQVYNLAYDLAKKAEKTYCFERGISHAGFIQSGYFDAGWEGLLAGEQLYVGLKQLEAAYQEKRGYDYEITKHVSLRQLHPLALLLLKAAGMCTFDLPEWLFDMDYSGHYKRRIKSVSVSIPCIAGPYTGVNATLRLLNNRFRNSSMANNYPEKADEPDDRFISYNIPITAIATSSAQNDAGMFELNFKDERYLPFEGAGVISTWRMELPTIRQFDYNTIADVVLHVKYTASEGGEQLKKSADSSVTDFMKAAGEQEGLFALIDVKHDMPNEWNLLVKNGNTNITIDKSVLPYMAQALNAKIAHVNIVAKVKDNPSTFPITVDNTNTDLSKIDGWNLQTTNSVIKLDKQFILEVPQVQLNKLEELIMVIKYSL